MQCPSGCLPTCDSNKTLSLERSHLVDQYTVFVVHATTMVLNDELASALQVSEANPSDEVGIVRVQMV